MNELKARLNEDLYLRDSAKALLNADIQHLKNDLSRKGVGERMVDRVKEGATDLYEEAVDIAEDNQGALTALIAAIVVWFARNPILSALGLGGDETDEMDEDYDEDTERVGRRPRSNR